MMVGTLKYAYFDENENRASQPETKVSCALALTH